jgi:hypothetical protein
LFFITKLPAPSWLKTLPRKLQEKWVGYLNYCPWCGLNETKVWIILPAPWHTYKMVIIFGYLLLYQGKLNWRIEKLIDRMIALSKPILDVDQDIRYLPDYT